MVYIESWDEFAAEAEKLYAARPAETRYCIKYRHCDAKLVLKVTDDKVCLKYRTDQAQDLKKIEKLNNRWFQMTTEKGEKRGAAAMEVDTPAPAKGATVQAAAGAAGAAKDGGKKKQKK
eukprot:tig00001107_g7099.t1